MGDRALIATARVLTGVFKEPFQLSVSIGESVYDPQSPTALESMMESADRAMYEEKRSRARPAAPIDPPLVHRALRPKSYD